MNQFTIPRIAFLGACNRISRVRNFDPRLSSLNILGLRSEVFSSIFPLPLRHLRLIFAVYDIASLQNIDIICVSDSRGEICRFHLKLELREKGEVPVEPLLLDELLISSERCWTVLVALFPDEAIPQPEKLEFLIKQGEDTIRIGNLDFYYAAAPPLTPERISAIRGQPRAAKFARIELKCKLCSDKLRTYTGLEKSAKLEQEGYKWYRDLADKFTCGCGKTTLNLEFVRESLHSLLGERIGFQEEEIFFTRLYEQSSIQAILERFERLLDSDPDEPDVQKFLEESPIFFHRFSPEQIIKKAPILNKFQTDFAILSKTGELFLIEIERPGKLILKKDGGRTAEFNHAFDQVQDWLHIISNHRIACLEMMGLKAEEVSAVRGVVIIGRESTCDTEQLRKLKSTDFGQTLFFTYDDFAESLAALIREMRNI